MAQSAPVLTLNNGVKMPAVGLGVYRAGEQETLDAVVAALHAGYRHIDTAAAYMNEKQVGEAVRRADVAREDVFIESKLWISDYTYDGAMHGFERSLRHLGMDQVDLYLLHQPATDEFERTRGAWRALADIAASGRARAVGVSNFSPEQIEQLIDDTSLVPAVNQVELHPLFTQKALSAFHARHKIVTQAWSPIGGVNRYRTDDPKPEDDPLNHPKIIELAKHYDKTAAQIILRWHLELGHSIIPKSVHAQRIEENFDLFDFALSDDDIAAIDALNTDERGGPDPDWISSETVDLQIPD